MAIIINVEIPDIPENLGAQSPGDIKKKLNELVAAKIKLEQALRRISTALKNYESKASGKVDIDTVSMQELQSLKELLANEQIQKIIDNPNDADGNPDDVDG